jgi:hypothetical protein
MSSYYPPFGNASAQLCQRCGRPLPPNETHCASCGHYNNVSAQPNNTATQAPSGMTWNTPAPQGPFGGNQSSGGNQFGGQQWGSSSAQPAQNSPFPPAAFPQQGFSTPGQFTNDSGFGGAAGQSFGPNSFYNTPASQQSFGAQPTTGGLQPGAMNGYSSNGFAQAFPGNQQPAYQGTDFAQAPARKSRPRVGLIIGIVVLLLLVVGGGIGGYLVLKGHNANTISTPTASTIAPTADPRGTPLFQDNFTNNKKGWDTNSQAGQYSATVGNGSLVLEDDNSKLLWELVPGGKNFKDFFLTVDATLSKGAQGNGYGIYIRGASNQSVDIATYYRFELYGDGTFAIFKGSVDATGASKSSLIANYALSSAIQKQGQVNHIAVSANGSTMSLLVNGQVLKTFTDNTYAAGSIALFVSDLNPPSAQATFSKLAIYPPQS